MRTAQYNKNDGKEITVTLEDALFSPKSMSLMYADGSVKTDGGNTLRKTIQFIHTEDGKVPTTWVDANGNTRDIVGATVYDESGQELDATSPTLVVGERYFVTFDQEIVGQQEIIVNANTFPGNYYITGDTFARSYTTGDDEYFQFIIPRAKMTAETSLTLEAEGDPSVFNMNLNVLRTDDGQMMKLVKYSLADPAANPEP